MTPDRGSETGGGGRWVAGLLGMPIDPGRQDPRQALARCAEAARARGARFAAPVLFAPGALDASWGAACAEDPGLPAFAIPDPGSVEAHWRAAAEGSRADLIVLPGIGLAGRAGLVAAIGGRPPGAGLARDPARALARLRARGAAISLLAPLGDPPAAALPILTACGRLLDACDVAAPGAERLWALLWARGMPVAAVAWARAEADALAAPVTYLGVEGPVGPGALVDAIRDGRAFASRGPTIEIRIEGRGGRSVARIRVPAHAGSPPEGRLEILRRGCILRRADLGPEGTAEVELDAGRDAGAVVRDARGRALAVLGPIHAAGPPRPAPARTRVVGTVPADAAGPTAIEIVEASGRVLGAIASHGSVDLEIAVTSRIRILAPGRRLAVLSPLRTDAVGRLVSEIAGHPERLLEPATYARARALLERLDPGDDPRLAEPPPLASWHTHTCLSVCALPDMEPAAILALAAELGYEAIALTDHMVRDEDNLEKILAVRRACEGARRAGAAPATVLVGGEFEVIEPGRLWAPEALVEACDIVVVSPNHYHLPEVAGPPAGGIAEAAAHELAMIETAVRDPRTDVVAHPFVPTLPAVTADVLLDAADPYHLEDILAIARERGVALEISPKAFSLAAGNGIASFYALCREQGVAIAPASDAHARESLRGWARAFPEIARVLSLDRSEVWRGPVRDAR